MVVTGFDDMLHCSHPKRLRNGLLVGCGSCPSCARKRSNEWSFRVVKDIETSRRKGKKKAPVFATARCLISDVYYITLTYNDQYLPVEIVNKKLIRGVKNGQTGFLLREDVVNFNKRLRIYLKRKFGIDNVRVCYSGEYGESGTHRPHFHLVLWNLGNMRASDFKEAVERCWSVFNRHNREVQSLGYVKVEVPRNSSDCVSYVTKAISYVTKSGYSFLCRQGGEGLEDYCRRTGKLTAPFLGFSQKIGLDYLKDNVSQVSRDGFCRNGVFKVRLPRYYQDKAYDLLGENAAVDRVRRVLESWKAKSVIFDVDEEKIGDIASYYYISWCMSKLKNNFRSKCKDKLARFDFFQTLNCFDKLGKINPLFNKNLLKYDDVSLFYKEMESLVKQRSSLQKLPWITSYLLLQSSLWSEVSVDAVKQGALNDLAKFKKDADAAAIRADRRVLGCFGY